MTCRGDFSPEQKRYLEGFVSGLNAARATRGVLPGAKAAASRSGPTRSTSRRRTASPAAGGKLADQEKFKREQHPFDAYERLKEQADNNEPPKPADNFRWRYYGLFYVAPAQNSYMCRLRIPNGILKHWQFAGVADLAERCGGALRACDDARQPADPRDRAEERGRGGARRSRASGCGRAARAPTTSATSPARRPPASIRRN